MVKAVLHLSQISGTDGQVGGVEGKSLTLTTLDGLMRQPTAWVIKRVGGAMLVFQGVAPDITLPAGILLPGTAAGIGWYLTDNGGQQANDESEQTVNAHSNCKGIKKKDNTTYFSLFFITFAPF